MSKEVVAIGHLIRKMRCLDSLVFERAPAARCALTLAACQPGRLCLLIDQPSRGPALVAFRHGPASCRYAWTHGTAGSRGTSDQREPLRLGTPGQHPVVMQAQWLDFHTLHLHVTEPDVGPFCLVFSLNHDHARLEIHADTSIRVFAPGKTAPPPDPGGTVQVSTDATGCSTVVLRAAHSDAVPARPADSMAARGSCTPTLGFQPAVNCPSPHSPNCGTTVAGSTRGSA